MIGLSDEVEFIKLTLVLCSQLSFVVFKMLKLDSQSFESHQRVGSQCQMSKEEKL